MTENLDLLGQKLFGFVDMNQEGYAIFDAQDYLIYCNQAYADVMGFGVSVLVGKTFQEILVLCFNEDKGVKVETKALDEFLARVKTQWRSESYRLFEIETNEGEWFLLSEVANNHNEVLIQTKKITEQKVLENKLLESRDKLRQLSLTDELTRVANRRCFVDSVDAELSRCRRLKKTVAYMILDLDYFKSINDNYGHHAGDQVLKHVAKLVKDTLRDYDIFGRIGGEEFAVFLGQTQSIEALEIAERVRQVIEESPLHLDDVTIRLTASIGVSLCNASNCTYLELYNEADKALYRAKREGRNRSILYNSGCSLD